MRLLKHLVLEAHRRSLWQVLGVYAVSSWVVLEVAGTLTSVLGLPDWVPSFSLMLLVVGLPIVLATAFVQEGGPGRTGPVAPEGSDPWAKSPAGLPDPRIPGFLQRHLTWRKALLGGVVAFSFLGLGRTWCTAWNSRRSGTSWFSSGSDPLRGVGRARTRPRPLPATRPALGGCGCRAAARGGEGPRPDP